MLSSWNHLRCFKPPLPRLSSTWQICGISPSNFNNQSSQHIHSKPEIYAVPLSLIKWLNTMLYITLVPIEIWLLLLLFYVLTSAASPRCVWEKRQKQHEVSDLNRDYILRAEFQINVCSRHKLWRQLSPCLSQEIGKSAKWLQAKNILGHECVFCFMEYAKWRLCGESGACAVSWYQCWRHSLTLKWEMTKRFFNACFRSVVRSKIPGLTYYRLSIYRGTIQHDIAHSTTTSKAKLWPDLELTKDSHGRSMSVFRELLQKNVTARYRECTVLWIFHINHMLSV